MDEPEKQQIGNGLDNYMQAAGQMEKAAVAAVKASAESGKAAAEITAGTAAGGPWGAVLSTAWSMRHTLLKTLVCICLFLLFLIVMVVSLPSIVWDSVSGQDGNKPEEGVTLTAVYTELEGAVSAVVDDGYNQALAKVEKIISDGGYDYDLAIKELINDAQSFSEYDVSYILAAYSASMQQRNTKKEDMVTKLESVVGSMFPVTSEEKQKEFIIPVTYCTYKPVTLTVVTRKVKTGTVNGVAQYRYETAEKTYYLQDEAHISVQPIEIDAYKSVEVTVPVYSGDTIIGTESKACYQADGKETLSPTAETMKYVECTIHPFDNTVIATAFGIDLDAPYEQFGITYGEVIQKMAMALKRTLYGMGGELFG